MDTPAQSSSLQAASFPSTLAASDPFGSTSSSHGTHAPPPDRSSAWTETPQESVQQWAEPGRVVTGAKGGARLKPTRNDRGEVDGVEWEEMVGMEHDLRVRLTTRKGTLLFPATIDERGEAEQLELAGSPARFSSDWALLGNLHHLTPHNPLNPTIFLNTHLRAAPPVTFGRVTASFEPTNLNIGSSVAACFIPLPSPTGAQSSAECVAFRRAGSNDARPTAVGWGSFTPLQPSERAKSKRRKGKERAADQDNPGSSPPPAAAARSRRGGAFVPSAALLWTGNSPVQQVALAPLPPAEAEGAGQAVLGIRSHTSFSLLHLRLPSSASIAAEAPEIVTNYPFTGSSFSRRALADFALSPFPSSSSSSAGGGLAVDVDGSLCGWGLGGSSPWAEGRAPEIFRLRKGRKKGEGGYSGFARVEYGGMRGNGAVVGLEDEVLLYDLRSPTDFLALSSPSLLESHLPFSAPPALFTSLLSPSPSNPSSLPREPTALHTLCTTFDILHLDERMPGRAVLRVAHNRVGVEGKGVDRTLAITELPPLLEGADCEGVQKVALTSMLHGTTEVFTTRMGAKEAPKVALEPYLLPTPLTPSGEKREERWNRAGIAFLPLSPSMEEQPADEDAGEKMDVDSSSDDDLRPPRPHQHPLRRSSSPRSSTGREKSGWACRMLDLSLSGALSARTLVSGAGDGSSSDDEEAEGGPLALWDEEVQRLSREAEKRRTSRAELSTAGAGKRKEVEEGRLLELGGLVEKLRPEAVLDDEDKDVASKAEETGVEELVDRARGMIGRMGQQDDVDEVGDIGAVTALDVLSLAAQKRQDNQRDDVMLDTDDEPLAGAAPYSLPLPRDVAALSAALPRTLDGVEIDVDSLASAAPASLVLRPADPPTHFTTLLPRPLPPAPSVDEDSPPASRVAAVAAARVAEQQRLASTVLLPRPIEPDEPTAAPNQPQPGDVDPPALHFSFFRPRDSAAGALGSDLSDSEADMLPTSSGRRGRGRGKKPKRPPALEDAWGARLLLAEWHVGADPRSYAWHNPYEGENDKKKEELAAGSASGGSQRKGRRGRREKEKENALFPMAPPSSSQFDAPGGSFPFSAFPPSSSFLEPSQPSYQPSSSSFTPASQPFGTSTSQSQHFAATQPTISISGPGGSGGDGLSFGSSQGFGGAASQTVPGAFAGRLQALKEKKAKAGGKKRKAGF
ncbi:hypothetical protein JCM10213_002528 [Rhodosporidiobolus nylandii]